MRQMLLLLLLPGAALHGELGPQEVAVIALESSAESRAVADHYMAARGIPAQHLMLIPGRAREEIPRAEWDRTIVPAIRKQLAAIDPERRLRCLVTTYDVPLKIVGRSLTDAEIQQMAAELQRQRIARVRIVNRLLKATAKILPDAGMEPAVEFPDDATLQALSDEVEKSLNATVGRIAGKEDTPEGKQAAIAREFIFAQLTGAAGIVQITSGPQPENAPRQRFEQIAFVRGQLQGFAESQLLVSVLPESQDRNDQFLRLVDRAEGLLGSIRWIDGYLPLLQGREWYASFDSELALIHWPGHAELRWVPNPLFFAQDAADLRWMRRTLMVARLDGPTAEIAKRLVDDALAAEKEGLRGTFYIDSRGLKANPPLQPGSYADYDESLRLLAALLKEKTALKVVHDDAADLFAEGSCPDAALYCGWYSLSKYVDSFRWTRGAVAYHIASGEASTLRRADSRAWCKEMLERGVTATLGPTYEPYLASFPRPDHFFPLLLSGEATLAETYARTLPFHSWVMTLVGDPLYNPYRGRPALKAEDYPLLQRLVPPQDEFRPPW